jgi:hypothetical protein
MMYHVGKVAKVAGKRGVPSDALSYNVCIYLYYIYLLKQDGKRGREEEETDGRERLGGNESVASMAMTAALAAQEHYEALAMRVTAVETQTVGIRGVLERQEQHQNLCATLMKQKAASMRSFHDEVRNIQRQMKTLRAEVQSFSAAGPVAIICCTWSIDIEPTFKDLVAKHGKSKVLQVQRGNGNVKREADSLVRRCFNILEQKGKVDRTTISTGYCLEPPYAANSSISSKAGHESPRACEAEIRSKLYE